MQLGKVLVAVVWGLAFAFLFAPAGSSVASFGRVLVGVLAVVHAAECVLFLPTLRKAPGSLAGHLAQTFAFGVVHYQDVRRQMERPPS